MALAKNSLFNREHELIIGPRVGQSSNIEPVEGRNIANRLSFSIEKTTAPNPNKSNITIFNISRDTRSFLEQKDMIVFLRAGFNGQKSNIFIGEILRREASRNGPDIEYMLECGDAERIIRRANVKISIGKGASNIQLFEAVSKAMGLTLGIQTGIKTKVFANGFSYSGLAADLLTEQTKNIGLEWNVQDGELRIMPVGQTDGEEAVVIGPETGLIGFPTKTLDGIKFTALLNPDIRPGRAVKVNTREFFGRTGPEAGLLASASLVDSGDVLKVRTVRFKGDTYEGDWIAEVDAVIPRSGAI